tara:strand:- start:4008 stop:4247 length:240 start_codon:yes stop_codon:yes gene_type:complete
MDLSDQFSLEHLIFKERICRTCGKKKDLLDDFYLIRKNKRPLPSAYSYECKNCTIKRVTRSRKMTHNPVPGIKDIYPDW